MPLVFEQLLFSLRVEKRKLFFHEFLKKGCEVESDKLDENRLDKKCDKIMQLTPVQIVTERQKSDI